MSDTVAPVPKVLQFSTNRPQNETGADSTDVTRPSPSRSQGEIVGANVLAPVIDIDRLYDVRETPGSTANNMVRALDLLAQASKFLEDARRESNPMNSDRFVQRLQILLPSLFACRAVGDGYGVIVNALQFAFDNLHGKVMTGEQITVMWRVLKELRSRPAMSLEDGIKRVTELEESNLDVDPQNLGEILDSLQNA